MYQLTPEEEQLLLSVYMYSQTVVYNIIIIFFSYVYNSNQRPCQTIWLRTELDELLLSSVDLIV